MELTHYGHACVLAEVTGEAGVARVLFDPGAYSRDFEELRDLDLILITHAHPDHADAERITKLMADNPQAHLVLGPDTLAALDDRLEERAHVVEPGDKLSLRGLDLVVTGGTHACIHPALPASPNRGFILNGSLFHPGDAFDQPPNQVEILLLPTGGPWMKVGEAIDYLRAVGPRSAVPIHQAGLAEVHQQMHMQLLMKLAPTDTEVVVLEHASPHAFPKADGAHSGG
ncbi:MBL fold metallo-hydrolase [Nocardia sp. CA-151230]|uniref:MBL fold metallo-hydrolase n=1 Tax=Nocardia sp. CA-151230 TaxID=3239982 RepID=UPI003D8A17CC